MTLQEIRNLANQGEGLRIEFKKKANHPDKIVKELIALANTVGGILLLGVDDDGTLSGHKYIHDEVFVLEKAIQELIFPPLPYEKFTFALNEKKGLAAFQVPKSEFRPHYLKEGESRKAYIRVKDRSIQASRQVWEILKKEKNPKNIVFTYGPKEEILLKKLEEKGKITLPEFAKEARIPKFLASRTLVKLVLANVLKIHPQETEDYFTLKDMQEV